METTKKYNSPKWNMLLLALVVIFTTVLLYFADYGQHGMAKLAIMWIPLVMGTGAAILYGLSRLIGKRYNWIITAITILLLLYIGIPIFFGVSS